MARVKIPNDEICAGYEHVISDIVWTLIDYHVGSDDFPQCYCDSTTS